MKISFDITTEESDIIAEQYAYNPDASGDKEEFVLEQFKKFGRDCIISYKSNAILVISESYKQSEIDTAKAAISF